MKLIYTLLKQALLPVGLLCLAAAVFADENVEQESLMDASLTFQPYPLEYGMTAINCSVSATGSNTFVFHIKTFSDTTEHTDAAASPAAAAASVSSIMFEKIQA